MTKNDLSTRTPLSTPNQQPSIPHKTKQKHLTNDYQQTCSKMEIINEENEDEEMTEQATTVSSTTPTCSSARLAAKLKQLMAAETTSVPMMIDTKSQEMETEDPKK